MVIEIGTLASACLPVLDRHASGWQALWLFGSHASGDARPDSDLDLALLCSTVLEKARLESCRRELEELLRRDVDLIDLQAQPTAFRNEILSGAVRIAAPDPSAADHYEALTLSLWQKLNEERRDLLADVLESGKALSHG